MFSKWGFVGIMLCIGLGCAALEAPSSITSGPGTIADCHRRLVEFDEIVRDAGVADTQATCIPGHTYLRVNRFLESFKPAANRPAKISDWLKHAKSLGDTGRRIELANLPQAMLDTHYPDTGKKRLGDRLDACAGKTVQYLSENPRKAEAVIADAEAADDYSTLARVIGLYPISGCVVLSQLDGLQDELREGFQDLPENAGRGNTFVPGTPRPPLSQKARGDILERAAGRNVFDIPAPPPEDLERLFAFFAPVWHVMPHEESDRIGRPYWRDPSNIAVDTGDPVTYRYPSFTRFDGQVLLQLNYVAWFPSRPAAGMFDLYSGRLDGVIWRVTLAPDGGVLLYDSVHCCGCYHKLYPVSPALTPRPEPDTIETPLILTKAIPDNESARVVVHLSKRAHYVIGLTQYENGAGGTETYRFAPYRRLRRLPIDGGSKSMFGPDSIVDGSERMERWFVWPTGVPSAGAMRQRGHHPIALVGRRYFDEARFLERVFVKGDFK